MARLILQYRAHIVVGERGRLLRIVPEVVHDAPVAVHAAQAAIERADPQHAAAVFHDSRDARAAQGAGIARLVLEMQEGAPPGLQAIEAVEGSHPQAP